MKLYIYACFILPFWYLCLFLSLLLKEEMPLESQWERLVRLGLTAMASVCLILLSVSGPCVRTVCVHAHVCIIHSLIIWRWASPLHLQLMRSLPQMFIVVVISMTTTGVGGTGVSETYSTLSSPEVGTLRFIADAICNTNRIFKISFTLNMVDES